MKVLTGNLVAFCQSPASRIEVSGPNQNRGLFSALSDLVIIYHLSKDSEYKYVAQFLSKF